MFERPQTGERTILVHVSLGPIKENDALNEFNSLAISAGAEIVGVILASRDAPHAKTFVGSGKLEEIRQLAEHEKAELILFNRTLSPAQERNLERTLKARVVDRTGLILDIFADRARTFEGKLQVELAQLQHLSTRLIRGWTHLERQKGGIGLRGPGETQLESDRRLIRNRIKTIRQRLEKIRNQRAQSGIARKQGETPTVALVGYTNAGKSTLFNNLTEAEVYAEDKLFATLDPTARQVIIKGLGRVIFVDTVGFIQDLPHDLIDAFQATLEETQSADLLLHVIDASDKYRLDKIEQVQTVIEQIGAEQVPQLLVYNKMDLCEKPISIEETAPHFEQIDVSLSALENSAVNKLRAALGKSWKDEVVQTTLHLAPSQAQLRAALFDSGGVVSEEISETGQSILKISLLSRHLDAICRRLGLNWYDYVA